MRAVAASCARNAACQIGLTGRLLSRLMTDAVGVLPADPIWLRSSNTPRRAILGPRRAPISRGERERHLAIQTATIVLLFEVRRPCPLWYFPHPGSTCASSCRKGHSPAFSRRPRLLFDRGSYRIPRRRAALDHSKSGTGPAPHPITGRTSGGPAARPVAVAARVEGERGRRPSRQAPKEM